LRSVPTSISDPAPQTEPVAIKAPNKAGTVQRNKLLDLATGEHSKWTKAECAD
jgi:hypothetical protein